MQEHAKPLNEFTEFEEIEHANWLHVGYEGTLMKAMQKASDATEKQELEEEMQAIVELDITDRNTRLMILKDFPEKIKRVAKKWLN